MLILLLYQFISSLHKLVEQNENINLKQSTNEIPSKFNNFILQQKHSTNSLYFNVSETSFFRPLKVDLNNISNNEIHFISFHGTQYIFLYGINTLSKKSISFESIFVSIETTELNVYNLSLIESPIFCSHGQVSINVSYLNTDILSISAKYISTINVSQQFIVLKDNLQNDQIGILEEPHAEIILQENAKYSQFKSINPCIIPSQFNLNEILEDNNNIKSKILEDDANPHEESNNDSFLYFFDSSLEEINIYSRYVFVKLVDSTVNITANASNQIEISTNSSNITINIYESPSYRNHIILDLFLIKRCILTFGSTFDHITNSFVLEDIKIHHSELITAQSSTVVPYVSFIPIENVTFIPERHNSENFCLCLKSRFNSCVSNNECLLYHVDKSNYFFGSNSSFLTQIARSKASIINIYVTYTGLNTNDYHIVALKQSPTPGKVYNFISTSESIQTILSVHDTALDNTTPISLSFTDISRVILQLKTGVVTSLTLENSQVTFDRSFSIPLLTTDLYSLSSQQSVSIRIDSVLTLARHSQLYVIGLDLILAQNATMEIEEISYFPSISFFSESVSFSDGDIEFIVRIDQEGPATLIVKDMAHDIATLIDIHSSTNIQLNLIVEFRLDVHFVVSFQNAVLLPEKVLFSFQPVGNQLCTLAFIMPYDNEEGPGHHYNFANFSGNIHLILLTPSTVFTFINAFSRGDFFINNIPTMALNLMDLIESITLYEDSVKIMSIYNISLVLERTYVYDQLTVMTNATHPVVLSLGQENMKTVYPIIIEATMKNTTIFFDDSFKRLAKYPLDSVARNILQSIIISHHTFNTTLKTNLDAVPMVNIKDEVVGVLYIGKQTNFRIPANNYYSFRSGPELFVNITTEKELLEEDIIEINQSDFLAEKVTFYGNPFIFNVKAKSRTNYSIINATVTINSSQNTNYFEAYALNLVRSPMLMIKNVRVDYLNSDIFSLSRNGIQNFIVTANSSICDNSLNKISIEKEGITLFSTEPQVMSSPINGSLWQIFYGGSDMINITINENALHQRINLFLTGKTSKTIYFDSTWYDVSDANNFRIIVENNTSQVTFQADLMKFPNIVVVDSNGNPLNYTRKLYKAVYTNRLSFMVFTCLVLIIIIISAVLMIVGSCRYRQKLATYDKKQSNKAMLNIEQTNNSNEGEYS